MHDRPAHLHERRATPWARALLLLVWLLGLDVWTKYVVRVGACSDSQDRSPWSLPEQCERVDVAGVLAVMPAVRPGIGPLPMANPLERQLGALALLALVTIATITVTRMRQRQDADVLAIACIWAGAVAWSGPCLLAPGVGLTELVVGNTATGLGDVAMVFGATWLMLGWLRD
ncbi:MAG: hypothetical protein IAG13_36555 [Deltaproteobacteria bacterium]|nr:hypothetical protein [Nannocystaceae bacterium]